jgi:hypothetical protein
MNSSGFFSLEKAAVQDDRDTTLTLKLLWRSAVFNKLTGSWLKRLKHECAFLTA